MPTEEMGKAYLVGGILNAANGEIVGWNFDHVETTSLVDEPEDDTEYIRFLRDSDSMEFTVDVKIEWPNKFGKRKLKWCRKYLLVDLLSEKFPKKKNRRAKRLKRRAKNG